MSDSPTAGAVVIDGKAIARAVRNQVAKDAARLSSERGVTPCLAVVLVGDDPGSRIYVTNKEKAAAEAGIATRDHRLPASTTEADLTRLIRSLNDDRQVHGILVQLPLPDQIDTRTVLELVSPNKDVDGFHPLNVGLLHMGRPRFVACTPRGVMEMLRFHEIPLSGRRAVVIGRSNIVGRPMAALLEQANATVSICHSRTADLPGEARSADILVAAIGKARFVRGDWIKPGAVVIDVGINRTDDGKLAGDVHFEEARERAGYITPVPGGVGPMTIAMLLANTILAAEQASA
ncbi:MAG: bifunctional methylenetetrahydrofolate dehydrogenase/methenyltetrahydrofolate cyclohydrolase FolD [Deltaproteobacteria bacterium]|nr:bifunctional methylenetetrahydrofolate dehydrogenase/methenyltetrahydrofolate cyclohydrolase FolD [Deltaproteobacteria bacterium]